jgi:hypothetical protein
VISANDLNGIEVRGPDAMGNTVKGNYVGIDVKGSRDLGNAGRGCSLWLDTKHNTVVPGNVLAYNDLGVNVLGSDTYGNAITQNSIFANETDAIRLDGGGNRNIPGPAVVSVLKEPVQISASPVPTALFRSLPTAHGTNRPRPTSEAMWPMRAASGLSASPTCPSPS